MANKDVILHDKQENDLYPVTRTSNVYDSSNHNLDELLAGKQASLSTSQLNAVNSGVTSSTVAQVATNTTNISQLSNPNLLINGDFSVNQRGSASYTGAGKYTVDRWLIYGINTSVTPKSSSGVTLSLSNQYARVTQILENPAYLSGQTITVSCKITNSTLNRLSRYFELLYRVDNTTFEPRVAITGDGIYSFSITLPSGVTYTDVRFYTFTDGTETDTFDIEWCKLELGSIATPFSPRPYAEELALCQRYYFKTKPSGTNAYYHLTLGMVRGGIITLPIVLPREMRPYYTVTPKGNFQCLAVTGSNFSFTTGQTINVTQSSLSVIDIAITQSTMTDGHICQLRANNDLTATIEVDAEIY